MEKWTALIWIWRAQIVITTTFAGYYVIVNPSWFALLHAGLAATGIWMHNFATEQRDEWRRRAE